MYQSMFDSDHALLVGLFSKASNDDADYQRYVDSILDANRHKPKMPGAIAVLIVERGNPIPSAQWRKRIAEATHDIGEDVLFVLCSADPIMRGVSTAINWIRTPRYEVKVVSSIPALLDLVRLRRPAAVGRVEEIVRTLQVGDR